METMLVTSPTKLRKTVPWILATKPVPKTVMTPPHVQAYPKMTIPILVLQPMEMVGKNLNAHQVPKHPDVVPFPKVLQNVLMKL